MCWPSEIGLATIGNCTHFAKFFLKMRESVSKILECRRFGDDMTINCVRLKFYKLKKCSYSREQFTFLRFRMYLLQDAFVKRNAADEGNTAENPR